MRVMLASSIGILFNFVETLIELFVLLNVFLEGILFISSLNLEFHTTPFVLDHLGDLLQLLIASLTSGVFPDDFLNRHSTLQVLRIHLDNIQSAQNFICQLRIRVRAIGQLLQPESEPFYAA